MTRPVASKAVESFKLASEVGIEEIKASIPADATRVQVRLPNGQTKFRPIDEIEPTDLIVYAGSSPRVMKGQPGRPPTTPDPAPTSPMSSMGGDASTLQGTYKERKRAYIESHPLMTGVAEKLRKVRDPVIRMTLEMTAKELIGGEFDREELESVGRDSGVVARALMANVKTLSDMWYRHVDSQKNLIDLRSPQFRAIFEHLLETFRVAMDATGVPEDQIVSVFSEATKLIDEEEWMHEANVRQSKVTAE